MFSAYLHLKDSKPQLIDTDPSLAGLVGTLIKYGWEDDYTGLLASHITCWSEQGRAVAVLTYSSGFIYPLLTVTSFVSELVGGKYRRVDSDKLNEPYTAVKL